MSAGDIHIWKAGTNPPEAECGYVPETVLHEGDVETGATEWVEIIHAEPTGASCTDCVVAATPEPEA